MNPPVTTILQSLMTLKLHVDLALSLIRTLYHSIHIMILEVIAALKFLTSWKPNTSFTHVTGIHSFYVNQNLAVMIILVLMSQRKTSFLKDQMEVQYFTI